MVYVECCTQEYQYGELTTFFETICFQICILYQFYSDKTKKSVLIIDLRCKWLYVKVKYVKVLLIDFPFVHFINIILPTIYRIIVWNHKESFRTTERNFVSLLCDWEQTAFKSVWVKYASKLECLLTHQKWQTNKKDEKSILKSIKLARRCYWTK